MTLENAKATFRDQGDGWTYWLVDYYDPSGETQSDPQDSPTFLRDIEGNPFDTDKIYLAASDHPLYGDGLVAFRFDPVTGLPVIIGGPAANGGNGSPANTNTLGGYEATFQTPQSGELVSFYRLPNNRLVLINQPILSLLPKRLRFPRGAGATLKVKSVASDLDWTTID